MSTLYSKVDEKDIAKYVIFSGDPFRVNMLSKYLENPEHISFAREFNTYTGTYKGVRISVTSTGIGAPSACIAMEEMYSCGMEVAIRMGTVMGLSDDMLGKIFIPSGAMRGEGTSDTYAPKSFPAIADYELTGYMSHGAELVGREVVGGISASLDGFYSQMRESKLSKQMNYDIFHTFHELKRYNIKGVDMETSAIFTLASLMGIRACTVMMTTVLENLKQVLEGDARTRSEEDLCRSVLEGIVLFDKEKGDNKNA